MAREMRLGAERPNKWFCKIHPQIMLIRRPRGEKDDPVPILNSEYCPRCWQEWASAALRRGAPR